MKSMCEKNQNNQSFVNGVLLGGLIGAAVGFLYAPQTGTETRRKLKQSAENLKDRAEPLIEQFETRVIPVIKEVQTASAPVRKEFMEKVERLVDEVEGKIIEEKNTAERLFASRK